MRRAWILGAMLAAGCAALIAGCGGTSRSASSSDQGARQAAESYVDAHNGRDFVRMCDLLSAGLRQQLGGENCPRFVEEQTSGGPTRTLKLVAVRETDHSATATLETSAESGARVRLKINFELQDGRWLVTGF